MTMPFEWKSNRTEMAKYTCYVIAFFIFGKNVFLIFLKNQFFFNLNQLFLGI